MPAEATPGQAAYEAWFSAIGNDQASWQRCSEGTRARWEATVQAGILVDLAAQAAAAAPLNAENARLREEAASLREQLADVRERAEEMELQRDEARWQRDRLRERLGARNVIPEALEAAPPVTPLDTALEHVREARQFLGERNRYRKALEAIAKPCPHQGGGTSDWCCEECAGEKHRIARETLNPSQPSQREESS